MVILLGLLPLVVAIAALVVWPRSSQGASLFAVFVALQIVLFFIPFRLPLTRIALSFGEGGATALPVFFILFPAVFFYQVQHTTGAMVVLQRGIAKLCPRREVQILLLVFGVGPIVEAMSGFGVGAVMIIPLLNGLETNKLKAAQLSLFSQLISPWGALGVGTSLAATISGIRPDLLSIQSALLLAPLFCFFTLLTLFISGGKEMLERYWPLALGVSCLQIGGLFLGSHLDVALAGIIAGLFVVIFLVAVSCPRWNLIWQSVIAHHQGQLVSPLFQALIPYVLLMTSLVFTRLLPFVSERLQTRGVLVIDAIHLHFAVLYSPGLCLLFATIVPVALFSFQPDMLRTAFDVAYRRSIPGFATILGFLVTAALMQESGMTTTLGHAAAMMGPNYVWVATLIGGMSGWLSGSPLSGNALTVPMQVQASAQTGLPLSWVIAAQNTSAALASIVSPTRLILIATAARVLGQDGLLLRRVAPIILWSIALVTTLLEWFLMHTLFSAIFLLLLVNLPFLLMSQFANANKREETGHKWQTNLLVSTRQIWKWRPSRFWIQLGVYGGLILSYVLYGSYSPVTAPILGHLDPLVFYCFSLLPIVPLALWFVLRNRMLLDRTIFIRGGLLGGCLGTAFLCLTVALKNTNINETTVFSCVNGVTAALIAWFIFRQRLGTATWTACLCALVGAGMVVLTSSLHWQGDFVAFVGGSLLVGNSFLIEHLLIKDMRQRPQIFWPVLGIQLLVMAGLATLFALCSGDWHGVGQLQFSDLAIIAYIALPGTLVPMIILTQLQQYVSAVTISFFAIIDPLLSAALAFVAGERLPLLGYVGFGFVLVSVLFQAIMGARETSSEVKVEMMIETKVQGETHARTGEKNGAELLHRGQMFLPAQRDSLGAHSRTILAHLAEQPQGARLRDLQRSTHLSSTQLQHLLSALQQRGYVLVTAHRYTLHPNRPAHWQA